MKRSQSGFEIASIGLAPPCDAVSDNCAMVFSKLTCELHLMVFPRCLVTVIRARKMYLIKLK